MKRLMIAALGATVMLAACGGGKATVQPTSIPAERPTEAMATMSPSTVLLQVPTDVPTAKADKSQTLHLIGGDITEDKYRAGVELALHSPAVLSGDFGACGYLRGLNNDALFGNQIPTEPSVMLGWISVPGQAGDTMYEGITQMVINQECAKVFK